MQSVSVDIVIGQQKPRNAGFYIYFDILYAIKPVWLKVLLVNQ